MCYYWWVEPCLRCFFFLRVSWLTYKWSTLNLQELVKNIICSHYMSYIKYIVSSHRSSLLKLFVCTLLHQLLITNLYEPVTFECNSVLQQWCSFIAVSQIDLRMAQWDRLRQLPVVYRQQLHELYDRDALPMDVRHYLSAWIEKQEW